MTLFLGLPPQRRQHHAGLAAKCVSLPALQREFGAAAAALSTSHLQSHDYPE